MTVTIILKIDGGTSTVYIEYAVGNMRENYLQVCFILILLSFPFTRLNFHLLFL